MSLSSKLCLLAAEQYTKSVFVSDPEGITSLLSFAIKDIFLTPSSPVKVAILPVASTANCRLTASASMVSPLIKLESS